MRRKPSWTTHSAERQLRKQPGPGRSCAISGARSPRRPCSRRPQRRFSRPRPTRSWPSTSLRTAIATARSSIFAGYATTASLVQSLTTLRRRRCGGSIPQRSLVQHPGIDRRVRYADQASGRFNTIQKNHHLFHHHCSTNRNDIAMPRAWHLDQTGLIRKCRRQRGSRIRRRGCRHCHE